MVCGPPATGKTHLSQMLLGVDFETTTAELGDESDPTVWEGAAREALSRARDWDVAAVLDGRALESPAAAAHARRLVDEVYGADAPPVLRMQLRPSLEDLNRNRRLASPSDATLPDLDEAEREAAIDELIEVDGIHTEAVSSPKEIRRLLRRSKVPKHKWYQSLRAGPVTLGGPSDAREKADMIAYEDVVGRTILDVCSATGIVSMLLKDRGAKRVEGVELAPRKYAKAVEMRKTLRTWAQLDTDVEFHLGDAFKVLPRLGRFDTVFIFGALHYFENFEEMLANLANAASNVAYVEFLIPDAEPGLWNRKPGVQGYVRKSGRTVYAADVASLHEIVGRRMPGFTVTRRRPSGGLTKRGLDAHREIWTLRRTAGDD